MLLVVVDQAGYGGEVSTPSKLAVLHSHESPRNTVALRRRRACGECMRGPACRACTGAGNPDRGLDGLAHPLCLWHQLSRPRLARRSRSKCAALAPSVPRARENDAHNIGVLVLGG